MGRLDSSGRAMGSHQIAIETSATLGWLEDRARRPDEVGDEILRRQLLVQRSLVAHRTKRGTRVRGGSNAPAGTAVPGALRIVSDIAIWREA